jgi:hypothetical protein
MQDRPQLLIVANMLLNMFEYEDSQFGLWRTDFEDDWEVLIERSNEDAHRDVEFSSIKTYG